jgi:hypothetical protein
MKNPHSFLLIQSFRSITIVVFLEIIHSPVFYLKTMFLRLDCVPFLG